MLRSKVEWFDGGEKVSKMFFKLEKINNSKRAIYRLDHNDELITDDKGILNILKEYYRQLYTSNTLNPASEHFNDITIPKVKQDDYELLVAPISLEEIRIAIKQMKRGKCPGIDGIPIEWYQKFLPLIANTLHSLYTKIVDSVTMHSTALESAISLMSKKNKNRLKVAHWRPLNLCNCDYKIYAKILANRIQYVIPYLISQDQFGFMKNRQLAHNVLELNMVIDYCQRENLPSLITQIDFKKAFDMIEWNSIKLILGAFGFPDRFIQMIMACFEGFRARVINNGRLSEYINIECGTKQGCPVSSLIFLLIIETVSLKLKQNNTIKGINICGNTKRSDHFADDLWTSMRYDQNSFQEQFKIFQQYEAFSGLSINYDKTEIMRIATIRHANAKFYSTLPLKWSDGSDGIDVLGFKIYNEISKTTQVNYDIALDKAENIMKVWAKRSLTLLGKVQIINTLIVPLFTFRCQALPSPSQSVCEKFKNIIRKFLWNGKVPRISYEKLAQPIINGGLKLVDLDLKDKSLKINAAVQLIQGNTTDFINACVQYDVKIPKDIILKCNISKKDIRTKIRSEYGITVMLNAPERSWKTKS